MQSDKTHILGEVQLRARYHGDESEAFSFLETLPESVISALNAVFGRISSHPVLQERQLSIQKLPIDLGKVSEGHFSKELEDELTLQLWQILETLRIGGKVRGSEGVEWLYRSESKLKLLSYLLLYGMQPWWAANERGLTLSALLEKVLEENPAELVAMLKRHGSRYTFRKRIITRLEEEELKRILRLLEPDHAAFIINYIRNTVQIHKKKRIVEVPRQDFRIVVWDFVLEYTLSQQSSRFNRKQFIKRQISGLARHYSRDFRSMLQAMCEAVQHIGGHNLTETSLPVLINELTSELQLVQTKVTEIKPDGVERIRQILEGKNTLSKNKQREILHKYWKRTVQESPKALRQLIKNVADRKVNFGEWVDLFEESQLKELIYLIEPDYHEFVLEYPKRIELRTRKDRIINAVSSEIKKALWEFVLTYLLIDRGSHFNRKAFIKSTLEQLSILYRFKLEAVVSWLHEITRPEERERELHFLLGELMKELEPSDTEDDIIHLYPAEDVVQEFLKKEVPGMMTKDQKHRIAMELYRLSEKPHQLNRIIHNHRVQSDVFIFLWSELDSNQQQKLIEVLAPDRMSGWEQVMDVIMEMAGTLVSDAEVKEMRKKLPGLVFNQTILGSDDLEMVIRKVVANFAKLKNLTIDDMVGKLLELSWKPSDRHIRTYLEALLPVGESAIMDQSNNISPLTRKMDSADYELRRFFDTSARQLPDHLFRFLLNRNNDELAVILLNLEIRGYLNDLTRLLSEDRWKKLVIRLSYTRELEKLFGVLDVFKMIWNQSGEPFPEETSRRSLLLLFLLDRKGRVKQSDFVETIVRQYGASLYPVTDDAIKTRIAETLSYSRRRLLNQIARRVKAQRYDTDASQSTWMNYPNLLDQIVRKIDGRSTHRERISKTWFAATFQILLKQRRKEVINRVLEVYREPKTRSFWINELPGEVVENIIKSLISSIQYNLLNQWFDLLFETLDPEVRKRAKLHRLSFMLEYAAEHRFRSIEAGTFFIMMLKELSAEQPPYQVEYWLTETRTRLVKVIESRKLDGYEKITSQLRTSEITSEIRENNEKPQDKTERSEPDSAFDEQQIEKGEAIYIECAGLILVAPFFTQLFKRLGFIEQKDFVSDEYKTRAVSIMDYITTGRFQPEEHQLVLHKILAGLPAEFPLDPVPGLSDEEIATADSMLDAVITNWKAIGNTSREGLREAFLQREGKLTRIENGWDLTVATHGIDVLLEKLPWGITIIRLPWMHDIINVQWK